MGDNTKIQWTHMPGFQGATWNPIRGCSMVSPGCQFCYAMDMARRFAGPGQPYEGLVRLDTDGKAKAQWNGTVKKIPHMLDQPLRWTKPRMVFVNSTSDLFFEALDYEYIAAIFAVMAGSPEHVFQVLTKRPQYAQGFFEWLGDSPLVRCFDSLYKISPDTHDRALKNTIDWPLPNVWLGVSVENQEAADLRVPILRKLPAAVHWISQEPQLGPVVYRDDVFGWKPLGPGDDEAEMLPPVRWVVIGGESGHNARPFDVQWARDLVAQSQRTELRVFVKQMGANAIDSNPDTGNSFMRFAGWQPNTVEVVLQHRKGGDSEEWPEELQMQDWPRVA